MCVKYLTISGCHWPELHLLAEGQVISSLHHHLHQLAKLGFDLDRMNHISQDAHIPEGRSKGQYTLSLSHNPRKITMLANSPQALATKNILKKSFTSSAISIFNSKLQLQTLLHSMKCLFLFFTSVQCFKLWWCSVFILVLFVTSFWAAFMFWWSCNGSWTNLLVANRLVGQMMIWYDSCLPAEEELQGASLPPLNI